MKKRAKHSAVLAVVSALFAGAEGILPTFTDAMPKGIFAGLSFLAIVGAIMSHFWLYEETGDE